MGKALFPWGWPLIGRDTGATLLEYILRVDWSMLVKDNIKRPLIIQGPFFTSILLQQYRVPACG